MLTNSYATETLKLEHCINRGPHHNARMHASAIDHSSLLSGTLDDAVPNPKAKPHSTQGIGHMLFEDGKLTYLRLFVLMGS